MDNINCVKRKIEGIIKESPVPEDLIHSKNTLEWLFKLNSAADEALKIAALGHDIERAIWFKPRPSGAVGIFTFPDIDKQIWQGKFKKGLKVSMRSLRQGSNS